ncbi:MAG: CinA-like protein [Phycisphaerales bacterium]|nr:CinA-like protein [Phycisphaerales bacterium]
MYLSDRTPPQGRPRHAPPYGPLYLNSTGSIPRYSDAVAIPGVPLTIAVMDAIILSIGDELVLGQTIDTNSAWLSQQLAALGVWVRAHATVPDDQTAIEQAIRQSAAHCDFLIISGGIGPTEDDLTRQALAAVMGVPLEENAEWMTELHKFFEARGRPMPAINRIQAMIPRGAKMLFNTAGTAAGIHAVVEGAGEGSGFGVQGSGKERIEPKPSTSLTPELSSSLSLRESRTPNPAACQVFVTPGVPKEMKAMFARDVLPIVKYASGGAVILSRTLHTFGLGESAIAEKLGDLMNRGRNPSVGTTVSGGVVSLRINSRFPAEPQAREELARTEGACRDAIGDLIYGQDEQTLAEVVAGLLRADSTATQFAPAVATAESCTGGLLAKMLTDVPGSSRYFRQGYVTYSNEAKHDLLRVPTELIARHGAVSQPVAEAMARGAQTQSGAAYTLAITGIAGPEGGTPQKPVGTVWIALASPQGVQSRVFLFPGDREMVRDRSAKMALTLLRFQLMGKPFPV